VKPYAREEPPFKEAGRLKPGARQMGGQVDGNMNRITRKDGYPPLER